MHIIHLLLLILICVLTCGIVIYAKREKNETNLQTLQLSEPTKDVCNCQSTKDVCNCQSTKDVCNSHYQPRNYHNYPYHLPSTYIVKPHVHGYQIDNGYGYGPRGPI